MKKKEKLFQIHKVQSLDKDCKSNAASVKVPGTSNMADNSFTLKFSIHLPRRSQTQRTAATASFL